MDSPELRRFIRHPADIAIEVELASLVSVQKEYLTDISEGGLRFKSRIDLPGGTLVKIRIPLVRPTFESTGIVVWSADRGAFYEIGVEFLHPRDVFRARMVEQVCHIEHYKREVLEREGRTLSSEQAAMEWIEKYAAEFPRPGTAKERLDERYRGSDG